MTDLRRICEPAAYAAEALDGCHWTGTAAAPDCPPLQGALTVDCAVIGAGYTGLCAALRLLQAGLSVAVFDLHAPGWGASGRNGGFCCLGGAKLDRATILRRHGAQELAAFRAAERGAVDFVAARIAALGLEVDRHSAAGEVQMAHSRRAMAALRAEAPLLRADYGVTPRLIEAADLAAEGLAMAGAEGALVLPLGFALNPRKYLLGLVAAVLAQGGRIYGHTPVTALAQTAGRSRLTTPQGSVLARRLIVATNGYSAENLPDWMRARHLPVQSCALVTRPLHPAELRAQGWHSDLMAYDTRNLLHYFRLMPDRRFLFGMRGGLRWTPASQHALAARIRADFAAMFPAWAGVETPDFWRGLIALTRARVPHVGPLGDWPGGWTAFGYHGNGVAMGSWCGDQLARLALGQPTDLPGFFRTPPRRFEPGRFRRAAMIPVYGWLALRDRL